MSELSANTKNETDPQQNVDQKKEECPNLGSDEEIEEFDFIVLDESDMDQNIEDSSKEHPYWAEIDALEPLPSQLEKTHCEWPKPISETQFQLINRTFDLIKLAKSLKNEEEIAIDLEVDRKTYEEFVAVLLISTKTNDYLIDTICLKNDLMILAEIFTNSKIVKIMINSREKLVFLQQNFHLFVVNMFDIKEAVTVLQKSGLRSEFWGIYKVERDQKVGNFDFKIRPLPPNVILHLRTIPHYLIHYYTTLKNELIDKPDLYQHLLEKFKLSCKILHNNCNDLKYLKLLEQVKLRHKRELIVLEKMEKWRQKVAKTENVNTDRILNSEHLKFVVKEMAINANFLKNNKYIMGDIKEIEEMFNNAKQLTSNGVRKSNNTKEEIDFKQKKRKFNAKKRKNGKNFKRFPINNRNRFQPSISPFNNRLPSTLTSLNMSPNRNDSFNSSGLKYLFSGSNSSLDNSPNRFQYFDNNSDRRFNKLETRLQFEALKRSPF